MTSGGHTAGRVPTVADILAGDRRALAAAITLIESTREEDREPAEALLQALLPHAGKAVRLGISGAPGVGKSTFIEAFGTRAIAAGRRLAVLAIDPSSERSGGSILGDKIANAGACAEREEFCSRLAGGRHPRRRRPAHARCDDRLRGGRLRPRDGGDRRRRPVRGRRRRHGGSVHAPGAAGRRRRIARHQAGSSGARRYRRRHQGRRRA